MLVRERHLIIFVRNFRPCGKIGSPLSSIVKSSYAKGSIGMKSRKKYEKKKWKKIGKVRKKVFIWEMPDSLLAFLHRTSKVLKMMLIGGNNIIGSWSSSSENFYFR